MLILAGCGFVLFRTKKLSLEGNKCLGNILIFLSLPCVIINGFLVERTTERIIGLGISAISAALLIAIACPVGSNVAVYAQLHNCDYAYSVETVIISTFLAVVTMPLIVQLATMIW